MQEHTLIPGLATRLGFAELTLGRMPIFTKRSRARTIQIVSARLSKNGTMVTFALDTSFLRHTSTHFDLHIEGSEGVAAVGFWCHLCTIFALMPETTLVFLRRLSFFFPLMAQIPFPPSTPLNPFRFLTNALVSILSFLASNFEIEVSDLCFSSPSFSISDSHASISSDESPSRTIPIQF